MAEIKSTLAPTKQRVLTENETETTFNTWQSSILFQLVIDSKFSRYTDITDLGKWESMSQPHRGYVNDLATGENAVPADTRMTAVQKAAVLKVLLGSVSTFAPVISSKFITEQSTSFDDIFNSLRQHYGFRITGGRILDFAQFSLLPSESHETLWERISSFLESNLMRAATGITHLGITTATDEVPSPTLQNISVVLWLKAIHVDLPVMIKQKFATQLKSQTIFSIRDDISDALPAILAEMQDRECSVNYAKSLQQRNPRRSGMKSNQRSTQSFSQKQKICCLCEAAGRPGANTHFLSDCRFLPPDDKRYMSKSKVREVVVESDESEDDEDNYSIASGKAVQSSAVSSRVDVRPSPVLEVYLNNNTAEVTVDSGSEVNLILKSECDRLQLQINPTVQKASMADGAAPLNVVGEVNFKCVKTHHTLVFNGLVVQKLNCPILGGMPFQYSNDVFTRPKEGSIYIGDCCKFKTNLKCPTGSVNLCKASILRVPQKVCLLPGDELSMLVPDKFKNSEIAVEPRLMSECNKAVPDWLSCHTVKSSSEGEIKVKNTSTEPVLIKKDEQFAQIRHLETSSVSSQHCETPPSIPATPSTSGPFSSSIEVDPSNILSAQQRDAFYKVNLEFDRVFAPELGRYNGASGPFKHVINTGSSLPPQRPGRNPQYSRGNKELLQKTIDDLYAQGVFAKPEDVNVNVEYVSPSFLVKKANGGYRLVTSFGELAEHTRPQPAAMPNVDEVLRNMAQHKYIVKSDLLFAYFQIELARQSMKFAGIVTPFRGTLVYQRAVMGLPGSEASLETLLCRILGDLMLEGSVVKLAFLVILCLKVP